MICLINKFRERVPLTGGKDNKKGFHNLYQQARQRKKVLARFPEH